MQITDRTFGRDLHLPRKTETLIKLHRFFEYRCGEQFHGFKSTRPCPIHYPVQKHAAEAAMPHLVGEVQPPKFAHRLTAAIRTAATHERAAAVYQHLKHAVAVSIPGRDVIQITVPRHAVRQAIALLSGKP